MATNRLYTVFGLMTVLALLLAGGLATYAALGSFTFAAIPASRSGQGADDPSRLSAAQARLVYHHSEWSSGGGAEPSAAESNDPEIRRFVAYSNSLAAARAEQGRRIYHNSEWSSAVGTQPSASESNDPEIRRFVAYSNSVAAARAELARRIYQYSEWGTGNTSTPRK